MTGIGLVLAATYAHAAEVGCTVDIEKTLIQEAGVSIAQAPGNITDKFGNKLDRMLTAKQRGNSIFNFDQRALGACPGFRWNSSEGPCLNAGNGYATVA